MRCSLSQGPSGIWCDIDVVEFTYYGVPAIAPKEQIFTELVDGLRGMDACIGSGTQVNSMVFQVSYQLELMKIIATLWNLLFIFSFFKRYWFPGVSGASLLLSMFTFRKLDVVLPIFNHGVSLTNTKLSVFSVHYVLCDPCIYVLYAIQFHFWNVLHPSNGLLLLRNVKVYGSVRYSQLL